MFLCYNCFETSNCHHKSSIHFVHRTLLNFSKGANFPCNFHMVCRLHFFGTMTKISMYRTTKKQYLSLKWSSGCLKIICKELKLQLKAKMNQTNISVFGYRPIFGPLPSDKSINGPWDYAYSAFTFAVHQLLSCLVFLYTFNSAQQ